MENCESDSSAAQDDEERPCIHHIAKLETSSRTNAWQDDVPDHWLHLADANQLLLQTVVKVAQQFLPLFIIVYELMSSEGVFAHDSCHKVARVTCGGACGGFCEFTKAHVLSFPALASVVVVIVASQYMLVSRAYYMLLNHFIIVDLKNMQAHTDPLFLIILYCFVMACCHWCMHLQWGLPADYDRDMVRAACDAVTFKYVLPALVFISFAYRAYDLELELMPMSKYFEVDPEAQIRNMSKMRVIKEDPIARVLHRGRLFAPGSAPGTYTGRTHVYEELVKQCKEYGVIASEHGEQGKGLGRLYHVSQTWAAKLLLDQRFTDEDAKIFRKAWYMFSVMAVLIIGGAYFVSAEFTYERVYDCTHGRRGWSSDYCGPGLVVLFGGMLFLSFLGYSLGKRLTLPFRHVKVHEYDEEEWWWS